MIGTAEAVPFQRLASIEFSQFVKLRLFNDAVILD